MKMTGVLNWIVKDPYRGGLAGCAAAVRILAELVHPVPALGADSTFTAMLQGGRLTPMQPVASIGWWWWTPPSCGPTSTRQMLEKGEAVRGRNRMTPSADPVAN